MVENSFEKGASKIASILEELSYDYTDVLDTIDELSARIEDLDDALFMAKNYYAVSRKEIILLIGLLRQNGIPLPLEGHTMDINDLVPRDDMHKGDYDFPPECLNIGDFILYP